MAITEQRKPYEFLVRWDEMTGQLRGAHVQFYDAILRDGARISGQPSKAYGVGEGQAFPLADIVDQMHIDALAELDVRAATIDQQAAAIAARDASITTLTSERDAAHARIAELEAQLAVSQADDLPAAIRAERDRRIVAGVKVGDHWYHSDTQMQIQVLGMVIMGANLPAGSVLKTLDDGPQPATPQLAQALFQAIAQQMAALHAVADAAIAASTPLDAIPWPPTYTPA